MRKASEKFGFFQSRYLHLLAYLNLMEGRPLKAKHLLNRAFIEANKCGCLYEAEWSLKSKTSWFENEASLELEIEQMNDDNPDTIFMFIFPK